jgi:N-carbamoyl-L-amino-acid hydrolase
MQAVATGSHLDSVPRGGIFDGPLGVFGGLEAVRALQDADRDPIRPIEVVCFTEEEGCRFADGVLGSTVATGNLSVEDALAKTDDEGVTLGAALESIGFRGEGRLRASEWDSWLELHVEQGERLESEDVAVGIVTAIAGTVRCHVEIEGEADHAGTTSMATRRDPLPAAAEVILEVEAAVREQMALGQDTAVGTVGTVSVEPNAINVIPGGVELGIDIRDVDYRVIEAVVTRVESTLNDVQTERGLTTRFNRPYDIQPVSMSNTCRTALRRTAEELSVSATDLHSGAGHDTMQVATVTDSGMLFAPSAGGISHSPREWTDWRDCGASTRVLTGAIRELASA